MPVLIWLCGKGCVDSDNPRIPRYMVDFEGINHEPRCFGCHNVMEHINLSKLPNRVIGSKPLR